MIDIGFKAKLEAPQNANYCATVIRVGHTVELPGLDNLVGLPVFGYQALISKDTTPGTLGVVFPAEVQLSHEYVSANNLYRHGDLNQDPGQAGYLEDNRRVRAIKLRGHRSDALFMPLDSFTYISPEVSGNLSEGDEFDTLNGHEICRKYVVEHRGSGGLTAGRRPKVRDERTDKRLFPEQFEVSQYLKVADRLNLGDWVVVTQKLHGANFRVGNVLVTRKSNILERLADKLGLVKVQKQEYALIFGSHHVTKDASDPLQRHFYEHDIWTEAGRQFEGLVPENYVLYGELVGWASEGKPIQPHFTYDCQVGTNKVYIYRVAVVNPRGLSVDLHWDAVKLFCMERGLNHVPELWRGRRGDLNVASFMDTKFSDWLPNAVPLSADSPCDEGVCIRCDGFGYQAEIFKAKSPMFLGHESKMLDQDIVADLEEETGVDRAVTQPE